jgi:urease accessory protein
MSDSAALQKLLTWLSPAFPVGAFAWSAGLETAIMDGTVTTRPALENWITGSLGHGAMKADALILAEAWRVARNAEALHHLADLALALMPSAERLKEQTLTGEAFRQALLAWPMGQPLAPLPVPAPYPVVIGWAARGHDIGLGDTLLAFLTAQVHGQISVAVRLVPLGQTDGLKTLAALEPLIAARADWAQSASLDDLGGLAYAADLAQMRHETLEPRIFRS